MAQGLARLQNPPSLGQLGGIGGTDEEQCRPTGDTRLLPTPARNRVCCQHRSPWAALRRCPQGLAVPHISGASVRHREETLLLPLPAPAQLSTVW